MKSLAFSRIVLLIVLFFSLPALALPPHKPDLVTTGNLWLVRAYNDASPNHDYLIEQKICFFPTGVVGTHQRYEWVSLTFPDWNGIATQEGDQVFMHGDFTLFFPTHPIAGHDSMQWELVTDDKKTIGAGHWQLWVDLGKFGTNLGFTNIIYARLGKCDFPTSNDALNYGLNLPYPSDANGNIQTNPMGIDTSPTLK